MTSEEFQKFAVKLDWTSNKHMLIILLITSIILGIVGPYHTSNLSIFYIRCAYWLFLVFAAAFLCGFVARAFLPKLLERKIPLPAIFLQYTAVASVLILGLVIFLDLTVVGFFFWSDGFSWHFIVERLTSLETGIPSFYNVQEYYLTAYIYWYGEIWLLASVVIALLVIILEKIQKQKTKPVDVLPPGYKFLHRLPPEIGQDIICLSMEDHYIRVYTKLGEALVYVRMADAVCELEGYAGMQVHRSWWVATDAIENIVKEGRKHIVYLSQGHQAPVSGTHLSKLKERGYIQ